jgi:hypothetical protein
MDCDRLLKRRRVIAVVAASTLGIVFAAAAQQVFIDKRRDSEPWFSPDELDSPALTVQRIVGVRNQKYASLFFASARNSFVNCPK